jgi:hypothetical protein
MEAPSLAASEALPTAVNFGHLSLANLHIFDGAHLHIVRVVELPPSSFL